MTLGCVAARQWLSLQMFVAGDVENLRDVLRRDDERPNLDVM